MKQQFQNSSLVKEMEYFEKEKVLKVEFKDGKMRYYYENVPQSLAEAFAQADSAGKFFNKEIKNVFPFAKTFQTQS